MLGRLKDLITEANRRRVFRTTGVYLVGVWVISQGVVELAPLFGAPTWLLRGLLIAAIAATPGVVILAWMFDIGRTGIVRDPKDVERAHRDAQISEMQTELGISSGAPALVVSWTDRDGAHRMVFVDDFYIGRASDCRVRFYDPLVSRRHARVYRNDGVWQLEDLGSRNGTTFDGARISSSRLDVGTTVIVRVNEAGPTLSLEVPVPDEETTAALTRSAARHSTAHIREQAIEAR